MSRFNLSVLLQLYGDFKLHYVSYQLSLPVLKVNCRGRREKGKCPLCKSSIKRHASPTEPKHQHQTIRTTLWRLPRGRWMGVVVLHNHPLTGVLTFQNSKNNISHDSLQRRQHRANVSCECIFEAFLFAWLLISLIRFTLIPEFKFNFRKNLVNRGMNCQFLRLFIYAHAPLT